MHRILFLALFAAFCGSLFAPESHAAIIIPQMVKKSIVRELFPREDTGARLLWMRTPYSLCESLPLIFERTVTLEELTIAAILDDRKDLLDGLIQLGAARRPHWTDNQGNTLLFWAVDQAQPDLVDQLLKEGAMPTFVSPTEHKTLIHVAMSNRDGSMVKKLIRAAGGIRHFHMPALIKYAEDIVGSQGLARSLRQWAESANASR